MALGNCRIVIVSASLLLLSGFCFDVGSAADTITSSHYIKDPEAIVSAGNIFRLGFFSPANSFSRYVGIWYDGIPVTNPVWVANRNRPLNDSSGILAISEDGNLVVMNGQQEILWSSNVTNIGVGNSIAKLRDDGNLVLYQTFGDNLWESFQHPCNTLIQNMRLTANTITGERILLTSWRTASDPSIGSFSLGIDPVSLQVFLWNGSRPHWRSGLWNGMASLGVEYMDSEFLHGLSFAQGENRTYYLSLNYVDDIHTYFVLNSEGDVTEEEWDEDTKSWTETWKMPRTECDIYGKCGNFGSCNARNSPICSCLRGFEPKNAEEWNRGNWTSGCVRRRSLQCDRTRNGTGEVNKQDGFFKLETMKLPDFAVWSSSPEQDCREECLINCSCIAYSYAVGVGCMSWNGNLIDVLKFSDGKGADLYIRLAYSELGNNRDIKVIVSITVILGTLSIGLCTFISWRWVAKHAEGKKNKEEMALSKTEGTCQAIFSGSINPEKFQELPLFSLQKLTNATNNFDRSNMLGQGGFGPVYKGKLPGGQEIAVKRLSKGSKQGLEEFMNEVVVISKLQHRNLVKLLGCCVEAEEKMLVYEYMPNKSLDAFLFDPERKGILDWKKRFNIMEGICRGLLYLHRDSRLRIIHRDMKASNILLDQELNPKISDFGLARIFGGDEEQANTNRVVGTYGYMSPEYAMQGHFSEKSDVFSLGVLLLEIVSGRRNSTFYGNEHALSLIGFVWKLWNEGNIAELVDPVICDPHNKKDILRCIHVGLLCVQEIPKDRPTVYNVISMLNSEIVGLPAPKQPAFTQALHSLEGDSFIIPQNISSVNNVTITVVQGR